MVGLTGSSIAGVQAILICAYHLHKFHDGIVVEFIIKLCGFHGIA